jgi:DNA-binding NtrC family response regulator
MTSGKTKIVIVDDEQDLCFLLSSMLRAQGFDVESFFTLKAGLTGINRLKPDWVILDNNLPDGLGWEHNSSIIDSAPGVNIINISANPDSHRAHVDPKIHYLIKPINVNSIVELINKSSAA